MGSSVPCQPVRIRALRDGEECLYISIINRAIHGLSAVLKPEVIEGWIVPETASAQQAVLANEDREERFVAEGAEGPVGVTAIVEASFELRACYVLPHAWRTGCATALVSHVESIARTRGWPYIGLTSAAVAAPFYTKLGFAVDSRRPIILRNGTDLDAVLMQKILRPT